jgi:hypothetical protein
MKAEGCEHIWSPAETRAGHGASLRSKLRTWAYGIFSDEALMLRARARDHAAFDALVARHRDRLYTMALDFLGQEDRAGDVLCETVIAAFRDIDSYDAKCTPGTWLYSHAFRAVFGRLDLPPGKFTVDSRPVVGAAS